MVCPGDAVFVMYVVCCIVYSVWCIVYSVCCIVYSVCCIVYVVWCMVYGSVICFVLQYDTSADVQ